MTTRDYSLNYNKKRAKGYHQVSIPSDKLVRAQPLQFSATEGFFLDIAISHPVTRFDLSHICNLDETPISFKYLDGKSYNLKGEKTIWAKASQSGWAKRRASLVLCVFPDLVPRVSPMVIFQGKEAPLENKSNSYYPRIEAIFNEKPI